MGSLARITTRCVVPHQDGFVMLHVRDLSPNARPPHDYWILPGGGIETGETILQCAEREVLEETGLNARALEVIQLRTVEWEVNDPSLWGEPGRALEVFVRCEVVSGELRPEKDAAMLEIQVITLEQLRGIMHYPANLEQLLSRPAGTALLLMHESF
jgi:ADP-ribose pyrophosphatase YjhB (NUDIX family)